LEIKVNVKNSAYKEDSENNEAKMEAQMVVLKEAGAKMVA